MFWRLVDTDLAPPSYTAACDEAIVSARHKNIAPNTLHFYRRDRPTVSLGYFEKLEEAVDQEVAREHGVAIVRRMSGGSAIFTDSGQLIYSVILDKEFMPDDPNDSYELICSAVIRGLKNLGVKATFKPVNDILVNGRKISGSAQKRQGKVMIQHGTIIVDTDFDLMFSVLRSRKKIKGKEEMISLRQATGRDIPMDKVKEAVITGFSNVFSAVIKKGSLTHYEERLIERLIEEKYGREEYTLSR